MKLHVLSRRNCLSAAAALLLLADGCAKPPQRVAMQEDMRMGSFTLRATDVSVYSRAHQGVPLEIAVMFRISGGNRFDRSDFAETISRRYRLTFRTANGWEDRSWLLARDQEYSTFAAQANPPLGSKGYTLEIGNPYGEPAAFLIDLGNPQ
jgi:hypothetical protein